MREIKFRAWDKEKKKYYEPVFAAYKGDLDDMMVNFNGDLCKHTLNAENGSLMVHESMFPDRFILEQYTGLKDKTGKEIYEGDLLRIPAKSEWEEKNYSSFEVFFHDNDCADNHIGFQVNRMHNHGSIGGGFCGHRFLPSTMKTFEIIGNIHAT